MLTRRFFIKRISALAAFGSALMLGGKVGHASPTYGWYMPEERCLHKRTFISFGAHEKIWGDYLPEVQNNLGEIVRVVSKYEPVTVFCRKEEALLALEKCGGDNVTFITTSLDDIWMRDIGASFVINEHAGLWAIDLNFNGWGNKQIHRNDTQLAKRISESVKATHIRSKLVGEGGGIEVDGQGTAIMTESCWVNANRNLKWTREQVETEIKFRLGLRKIIWLPGIKGKDITDAHVDFYARFVKPGVVLANVDNDPDSYDYNLTRRHLEILKNSTDADGNKLVVHVIHPPENLRKNKFTEFNKYFAAGYINYAVINGAIIAPEFGDQEFDTQAYDLLSRLYPERDVLQINIDAIAAGGGGIHCVTGYEPIV